MASSHQASKQAQSQKRDADGKFAEQKRPAPSIPDIAPGELILGSITSDADEPASRPIHNQIAATAASDFAGYSLHSSVAMAAEKLGRDPQGAEASAVIAASIAADPESTTGTAALLESVSGQYICEEHQEAHIHYAVYGPDRRGPAANSIGGRVIGGVSSVYQDDRCACGSDLRRTENSKGQWDKYECAATGEKVAGATDSSINTCGAGLRLSP